MSDDPRVMKLATLFAPKHLLANTVTPQKQAREILEQVESVGLRGIDPSDDRHNLVTEFYRLAIAGEGPRAYEWADKPHRLVYDLCREIDYLRSLRDEDLAP